MRLATFNVLHGRALSDNRVDLDRYAAAIRSLDADLLALQEVDLGQERSHAADLTAVAAEAMGATAWRFAPALAGAAGAWARAGDGVVEGPQYGVGLASRYPVLSWRVVRLAALPVPVPALFRGRRRPVVVRDEPRVALVAEVDAPGGPLTVVSTHLSFLPGWNVVQLRGLLQRLPRHRPLVLMGDLNMGPAVAHAVTRLRPLATAPTFPSPAPRRQIDHILVDRSLRPRAAATTPVVEVSDHRPLVVEVESDSDG